jgi:DHA1 family bicyclomycin/chloramphenicol resistance-like MFS transporter
MAHYRAVLTQPNFTLLALVPSLNFCGFFIYISAAPAFLVDLLGVSTWGFAWLFIPMISGIMIGAWISGRLAGRMSPQRQIRTGYALLAAGVLVNLAICAFAPPHVALNVLPIMI